MQGMQGLSLQCEEDSGIANTTITCVADHQLVGNNTVSNI